MPMSSGTPTTRPRRRSRAVRAASLLLLVPLLASLLAGCDDDPRASQDRPAPDPAFRIVPGVTLQPPGPGTETCHATNLLLDAIDNTPAGATIRLVLFVLTREDVADALVAAHRRGVRVQVLIEDKFHDDREADDILEAEIGDDLSADSFLARIDATARGAGKRGYTHQKTWLFSQTGASRWVSIVGSANVDYACQDEYNDVYAFVGRRDVFDTVSTMFRQQVRDRPVPDPARTFDLGDVRLFFSPGFTLADEPIGRLLDRLPAAPTTTVEIAQLSLYGERAASIVPRLARLVAGGAQVRVVVRNVAEVVVARLREAGVEFGTGDFGEEYVHHKLTLVSWIDADGTRRRIISTGSDNLSLPSLDRDEVIAQIDADAGPARRSWRVYQRGYDDLFARATRAD
ncbi:phospholipase D-like domain-containing protein [Nocardioides sp.]|uniref:phospholipase D-like domain-containing protein n=1 Tax=Nocardioides sp. TaxID=35761 RepID=UPI0035168475